MWLARDKTIGNLYLSLKKPRREVVTGEYAWDYNVHYYDGWYFTNDNPFIELPKDMFPEVIFKNSPIKVELKIKEE